MTPDQYRREGAEAITMTYRNWRGEVGKRAIIPIRIWFGATEWHPTPGWLLSALDLEKGVDRDFALADCQFSDLTPAPDAVARLVEAARTEAEKAMRKFPQPNYVISKVAEEAGEVVKAAIHCAEGREKPENVRAEIVQAMAMLIRLYVEGDQVHGLPALAAMETNHD